MTASSLPRHALRALAAAILGTALLAGCGSAPAPSDPGLTLPPPGLWSIAAPAPEDITSTKKARVRLGKKSSAPRAEPSRNCFIACRPLSTT